MPRDRSRLLRPIWTALFAAALAAVPVLNGVTVHRASAAPDDRFGFHLEESARTLGIDFMHEAPTFDAQLEHIMPQVASTGASVSVVDFDRDGWSDLYVTNSREGGLNRLYRNNGDWTFEDVAPRVGLADVNRRGTGVSTAGVWGDYDNDGDEDLLLLKYGTPELFINEDNGQRFVPAGERAGLPRWVNANAATWLDYDNDGLLDLFIAGYWDETVDLWHLETTRIMPESFEYANNGGRKYLLRNRGDGTFEDVTEAMGIASRRWTLAVVAADLFGSGYPDLFLANDYGVAELFRNDGGRRFEDVATRTGIARSPKSGMNAAIGDVFNDGRLALYNSNISEPGALVQGNDLWVPREGSGVPSAYDNLASGLGIDLGGWSWGAQFGDVNNDGSLDLYLANGYVSAGERTSYWYDFSVIATGHSTIIGDAKNWPPMRGRSLSGYQRSRLWLNDGSARFREVAQVVGATDTYDGRSVALADLGNRGALDIIVANQAGPLLVYRNQVDPGRNWIAVELEGTASNRNAIGARVALQWDGRVQVQPVVAASGFSAQNQRRLHFGLGTAAAVDRIEITWPSGRSQVLERPEINRLHHVKEPHEP